MKSFWITLAATLVLVAGETQAEPITLDQAVQEALAHGDDKAVWAANLKASRATNDAAQARAGVTLSSTLSYSGSETWNNPGLGYSTGGSASASGSTSYGTTSWMSSVPTSVGAITRDGVIPQSASAGLTLGTPLTSLTVTGTDSFQTAQGGNLLQAPQGTANLTQVLWNGYPGGTLQATAEKAGLTLKVAELNAQASRNKLVMTIKQAFYTLLSAQENMELLNQTVESRKASLQFAQTKLDLRQATPLDVKQAQINVQSAELDLAAGQSALWVAQRRLANLMGRPQDGVLTGLQEPEPEAGVRTLDEAVDRALKQRIEPQVYQATARSAQIDADLAFGAATPTVTLTSAVTYYQGSYTATADQSSYVLGRVGLTVGAPILDAGLAAAQSNLAQAQKLAAQTQFQQVLKTIPVDVAEAWNAWQISLNRFQVSKSSVEVAGGQKQVVQAQYDAGLKTLLDLQTAEIALTTAQFTLLKAKITAELSALTLQNLLGE